MINYTDQIEALGLHAHDKSAEQNTPFIIGGVANGKWVVSRFMKGRL